MRVLIAAGGSGGHIYPAEAVIRVLQRNRNHQVFFVTSRRGRGTELIAKLKIPGKALAMIGMPRGLRGAWGVFFRELIAAFRVTKEIFDEFTPDIVLGHGGFVTFPALFHAWRRGVPICLQEQNVIPGLVNSLFLNKARRVFAANFGVNEANVVNCGNPVREGLWDHEPVASRQELGLAPEKFTLLILGGSQGAKIINMIGRAVWQNLMDNENIQVVWSTGESNYQELKETGLESARLKLFPFIEDIGPAYMAADLVISRAGALTISELNACGRAAVLIPYRHAAHNHQYLNARYQVEKASALMIEEKELDAQKLTAIILELYGDRAKLSAMAENSLRLGRRQAAPYIMTEMNRVVSEWRESS